MVNEDVVKEILMELGLGTIKLQDLPDEYRKEIRKRRKEAKMYQPVFVRKFDNDGNVSYVSAVKNDTSQPKVTESTGGN